MIRFISVVALLACTLGGDLSFADDEEDQAQFNRQERANYGYGSKRIQSAP